jgi:hypothetical protein
LVYNDRSHNRHAQDSDNMSNVWEHIPLEEYEKHMRHETVGQLQLLNDLTRKYLDQLAPVTAMFLGVSGGNGLEHIDNNITRKVYGIDINTKYLEETRIRFESRIPDLRLINLDIAEDTLEIARVDFIWGALIFEYVEISQCFKFMNNNIQAHGRAVITIQVNNGASSISRSGVDSIKLVGQIFKPVDPNELLAFADNCGWAVVDNEENILPNGKALKTYCFEKL